MRQEEFKMERTGLVEIGQVIPITEGKLPSSYYYTLGKAYAMSANFPVSNRIKSGEGKVVDIKETEKGINATPVKSLYSIIVSQALQGQVFRSFNQ